MNFYAKRIAVFFLLFLSLTQLFPKEGMWLPMLLKSLNETDMKGMGLKLSAEDIYSINQSSLKDAVVSFGGFCTGEMISDRGLILTNHHCGYGRIQAHSSVENDYLTDGYWAKNLSEELANPGLTATFIVRMEDVSQTVLNGLTQTDQSEMEKIIRKRIDSITKEATQGTHYEAYIRPFFYGNEYYMFLTETFKDVRLVGAPPSSIGKFGGDTDNWMWPRHTGDFSIFRIYADSNNRPAEYSEKNVPYQPKHHFPISLKGVEEGDFTMVYGFPGRTQEYLTSFAIRQIKEVLNPKRIEARRVALDVLDRHMGASDEVRIKYASKYASISNYWKKWIGENMGLERTNAMEKKQEMETAFKMAVQKVEDYRGLLSQFETHYQNIEESALSRSYFIEIPYRKVELPKFAYEFKSLIEQVESEDEVDPETLDKLKKTIESFYKDFDLATDRDLAKALLPIYYREVPEKYRPEFLKVVDEAKLLENIEDLYQNSIFSEQEELNSILFPLKEKKVLKLKDDPAFKMMSEFWEVYRGKISPDYKLVQAKIDSLSAIYMQGLRTYLPGRYYPDANSTLRLTYGKVEGYFPRDAVEYDFYSRAQGIIEKYDSTHKDFDLPKRLIRLIEEKDFGDYANQDGELPVCFIASNHTSGGNSGSPVINGSGELIGLNFDRNWEGTMSDINYDISLCRNISVDIRYVLFIIDRFAESKHIMNELNLLQAINNKGETTR